MAAVKSPRRRARELALQVLYAWQMSDAPAAELVEQMRALEGHDKADAALAEGIVRGVVGRAAELRPMIEEFIDRSFGSLSPVERAILYIGAFELSQGLEPPFKVVLNEAIELGKSFGGTGGHKYVNGVLEKLAGRLRAAEVAAVRRATA